MSTQAALKPIIFSGPMVKAILRNRKNQTRRVVKPQPEENSKHCVQYSGIVVCPYSDTAWGYERADGGCSCTPVPCKYHTGDTLWVREALWECTDNNDRHHYVADGPPPTTENRHYKKRPSIHMPFEYCRIFLEVRSVWAERVQDISEEDALNEGISVYEVPDCNSTTCRYGNNGRLDAKSAFRDLWDSINAKRGYGWDKNPWVFVLEFETSEY